jgi:signal transduction histidine kinase
MRGLRVLKDGNHGGWLVLGLLAAGVLAPTACVLWFMNAAVNNQRDASLRRLADAYGGQLKLVRDRLDSFWQQRAADLEREAGQGAAPAVFARLVERGLADSAVCLDPQGSPAYPAPAVAPASDPTYTRADWMAARALETWRDPTAAASAYAAIANAEKDPSLSQRAAQAEIRCLVRAGDRNAALRAIEENFGKGRPARGVDMAGRSVPADELLLAIQLMGPADARRVEVTQRLHDMVADYGLNMPSAQRLFVMGELRAASPGRQFPTYEAERLAARILDAGRIAPGAAAIEPSGLPDVWKLTAPGGRVIALYRTATIVAAPRALASSLDVALALTVPGASPAAADLSIAAGNGLPGWQISLSFTGDRRFDQAARMQTASYVWAALLAIAIVAATALAAGQVLRRQWRLAQLKTDLLAAVSHELKTPLASMHVLVDGLLEDEKFDPVKTRDYLELIAAENRRLSRLIGNFLTFSRIERNRQKFEFAETRPEDIVHIAVHAMRERLQAPSCQLEIDVEEGLPPLHADRDALVTVLLNLLDNAHKYTPQNRRILLRAYREGGRVVFAVKDNGIGIAPREQKRIFRRFYQVDRRLARETGGCGLGLSIVDFIVRAHGGEVRVESRPGEGSIFRVFAPFEAQPKAAGA